MAAYEERFPAGSRVRVRELAELTRFQRDWKWHHPLDGDRLQYAGQTATVATVGFYHGGDVLYTLDGIPGTWHEACLEPAGAETAALLPDGLRDRVASLPESYHGVHTVTAILDDGRRVAGVVVAGNGQVVRVLGTDGIPFDPRRVIDVVSEV
jgi:hypothetical protein